MDVDTAGGAKISVVGAADVTLPPASVIAAPRRHEYKLRQPRTLLLPQGNNVIVATIGMLLTVGAFTMFGIGAELGTAVTLAYYSEATQFWRVITFSVIAAVSILVFWYAKTAIRAMADPQPGSSISAAAGTSFTL